MKARSLDQALYRPEPRLVPGKTAPYFTVISSAPDAAQQRAEHLVAELLEPVNREAEDLLRFPVRPPARGCAACGARCGFRAGRVLG